MRMDSRCGLELGMNRVVLFIELLDSTQIVG
jgi:hypothetical protein